MRSLPIGNLLKSFVSIVALTAWLGVAGTAVAIAEDASDAAVLAQPVAAEPLPADLMSDARRLLAAGPERDAAKAARALEAAAAAGITWALVPLADLYRTGDGVAADPGKAEALYRRALEAGNVRDGAYGLGLLHSAGPLADTGAALDFFRQAAAAGNGAAPLAEAEIWRTGAGLPADAGKARAAYEDAVAAGREGEGAYGLGRLYLDPGPLRDPTVALSWFERAAAAGYADGLVAAADLYRTGVGATADPDRAKALYDQAMTAGAEREAAYGLGQIFMTGPRRDVVRAVGYFGLAASRGNAAASAALGDLNRLGDGVPVDLARARAYYEQALAGGDERDAAYGLGALALAAGPARNPSAALDYFRLAAAAGSGPALVALGDLYRTGDGVAADPAAAHGYYEQAVAVGDERDGPYGLGILARDGAAPDPASAIRWFERAAAAGNGRAMVALGDIYWSGQGVAADIERARGYYTAALETSEAGAAAYGLGRYYRTSGSQHDGPQALAYLESAAAAGSGDALTALGDIYRTGEGVKADIQAAADYYERAVAAGAVAGGAYGLGVLHWQGGPLQDAAAAVGDFQRAAEAGSPWALVALGDLHRTGFGTAVDLEGAKAYYERALGGPAARDAAYGLGQIYRSGPLADGPAAVRAFEQAASAGRTDAMVALADLYRGEGLAFGVPADPAKAEALYTQALAAGDTGPAAYGLALLELAPGPSRDVAAAVSRLESAVAAGSSKAMLRLGDLYRTGDGVAADFDKASALYQQAVTWGAKLEGATGLGLLYAAPGANRNMRVALGYLDYAADQGETGAMIALGDMYRTGAGVRANGARAEAFYRQALDAGLTAEASFGLGRLYLSGPLKDLDAARGHLEAAVAAGSGWAALSLARLDAEADVTGALAAYRRAAGMLGAGVMAEALLDDAPGEAVALAQRLLAAAGFDPGPADGAAGPKTRAAVTAFCAADPARSCPADAGVSADVLAALLEG